MYTTLDASNKEWLGFLYAILSACHTCIKRSIWPESLSSVDDTETLAHLKNELLDFIRTTITAGCPFRDIAQISFQRREMIISDTSIKSDDHMVHQEAIDKYKEKLMAIGSKDAESTDSGGIYSLY